MGLPRAADNFTALSRGGPMARINVVGLAPLLPTTIELSTTYGNPRLCRHLRDIAAISFSLATFVF
jgi:hypothetical protein